MWEHMHTGADQWVSGFTTVLFWNLVSLGHCCEWRGQPPTVLGSDRGKRTWQELGTMSVLRRSTYTSRCQVWAAQTASAAEPTDDGETAVYCCGTDKRLLRRVKESLSVRVRRLQWSRGWSLVAVQNYTILIFLCTVEIFWFSDSVNSAQMSTERTEALFFHGAVSECSMRRGLDRTHIWSVLQWLKYKITSINISIEND